jgi:hypothetical protein
MHNFRGFLAGTTLEINSMVKDPTYLDPGLVPGVQYSSHTILQQVQTYPSTKEETVRSFEGFPVGGHTI